jgi:hypothetical protein
VANIGSALVVEPGEHVIGRLVVGEGGVLFEGTPLPVSEPVARRVADSPSGWLDVLRETGTRSGGFIYPVLTDVPTPLWQLTLLEEEPVWPDGPYDEHRAALALARSVLDAAARVLDLGTDRRPGEVDVWPCLGAALLEPIIWSVLREVAGPADVAVLERLGELLAEPAASACREAVRGRREVA